MKLEEVGEIMKKVFCILIFFAFSLCICTTAYAQRVGRSDAGVSVTNTKVIHNENGSSKKYGAQPTVTVEPSSLPQTNEILQLSVTFCGMILLVMTFLLYVLNKRFKKN